MPTFRPDIDDIPTYDPGRPIEEVSRELGIADIIKLASNESPTEPFPEVQAAIAAAAADVNRYPETSAHYLAEALAASLGIDFDQLWIGPGSTSILTSIALATLPGGGSAVFATPSFVAYPMVAAVAGGRPIAVPLDGHHLDPAAMADAVDEDTTVLFYCNPNNPTGTHTDWDPVAQMIDAVDERVTIVIDEAYAEYVTEPGWATAIPVALSRRNVVVTRTFSKVYGLAGLRVGYAVGDPGTLQALKRPQSPFAVTSLAQVAAIEALRHTERLQERAKENAAGREYLCAELRARGLGAVDSQTNFVYVPPPVDAVGLADALLQEGVIVRVLGPALRISVGTPDENERFVATLDRVMGTKHD